MATLDVSTPNGYILATAIRGPDEHILELKLLFTARIRGLLGTCDGMIRTGPLAQSDASKEIEVNLVLTELKGVRRSQSGALIHWANHNADACRILGRAPYHAARSVSEYLSFVHDGIRFWKKHKCLREVGTAIRELLDAECSDSNCWKLPEM